MSLVPREVLQLLFLIAGPSSFGVFRLVCNQWKRVVDSEEFKLVLQRNPRCHVPRRWRWLKNVVSERDDEENLQFLPLLFSLFGDADACWCIGPPLHTSKLRRITRKLYVPTRKLGTL